MKIKKKSLLWLLLIIISLLFPLFGYIWNPRDFVKAALIGGGIILFAGLGNLIAPSANQTAYYDTRTGRRTTSTGKPYYSIHEDIQKHGKLKGFLWWITKTFIVSTLIGAYIGIVVYGIYALFKILPICAHGNFSFFFHCIADHFP